MKALYAAKKEIEAKVNELKAELGLPANADQKQLAEATAAIEKAQDEISKAQAELQKHHPGRSKISNRSRRKLPRIWPSRRRKILRLK